MSIRLKDIFWSVCNKSDESCETIKPFAVVFVESKLNFTGSLVSAMSRLLTNGDEIILASGSPRRRAYLKDLGLSFSVSVADIEEKIFFDESPVAYIERLAYTKAKNVAEKNPKNWIVAADTVVCFEGMVLEKPVDEEDAVLMLLRLSGQEHVVKTSICLFNKERSVADIRSVSTRVLFWKFPEDMVRAYVQTGEPLDKAGSYGIQGKGGFLVREIYGSYSNVVGLPLCEFIEMLSHRQLIFQRSDKSMENGFNSAE